MKLSKAVTSFKCDTCEKTFHDKSTLNCHTKVHTFVCKTCDKVFTSKDNLNEHTRYHNEKAGMDKIKQNVVQANELEDENEISITKIAFNTEELFTKESNFSCGECGNEFTRQSYLTEHRRAVHEGVKYPCETMWQRIYQAG